LGIADIRDIPPEFDRLTALQARVRDAVRAGSRYHDPAIAAALATTAFPVCSADRWRFQTVDLRAHYLSDIFR